MAAKRDAAQAAGAAAGTEPIAKRCRVLVAGEPSPACSMLMRVLDPAVEIKVSAVAENLEAAAGVLAKARVDVITVALDKLGAETLAQLTRLVEAAAGRPVLAVGFAGPGMDDAGAAALARGVAEFIPLPVRDGDIHKVRALRGEIVGKLLAVAGAATRPPAALRTARLGAPASSAGAPPVAPVRALRPPPRTRPEIIAIGGSTGGPHALMRLFSAFAAPRSVPVLLTQHMPPNFTAGLAAQIQRATRRPCREAADGEPVQGGTIFVAPGDYHMVVRVESGQRVLRLNQDPPENFCRPSVDVMMRSIAAVYGARALAVILTGMGQDGREGCRMLVEAGGAVIAQDEPSSVVWGMPGAVAEAGLCSAIVPLEGIARTIEAALTGRGKAAA